MIENSNFYNFENNKLLTEMLVFLLLKKYISFPKTKI